MNFKPTKLKIIGGLIIWFVGNLIFWLLQPVPCAGGIGNPCPSTSPTIRYVLSLTFKHPFSWLFLVLIYGIWSLIQKKEND